MTPQTEQHLKAAEGWASAAGILQVIAFIFVLVVILFVLVLAVHCLLEHYKMCKNVNRAFEEMHINGVSFPALIFSLSRSMNDMSETVKDLDEVMKAIGYEDMTTYEKSGHRNVR